MKKIRKNAYKKHEQILKAAKHIEYFTHYNKYRGGTFSEGLCPIELRQTLGDLKEGYCNLYEKEDGTYIIRYAGHCKWIIKGA